MRKSKLRVVAVAFIVLAIAVGQAAAQCPGDCDQSGKVAVHELVLGTNIALSLALLTRCESLDRDGNRQVTVDELVSAVNSALKGCAVSPGPTRTPTTIPSPTVTATTTATATPNAPPQAQCRTVYRTFAGFPINLALPATDPGDTLHYAVNTLPNGADLEASSGLFSWTPSAAQLGPLYLPFTATDTASPPQAARGEVIFKVSPLDACTVADCTPATGCTADLMPLSSNCCGAPVERVAEPQIPCPEGRVVFLGANVIDGFGRLQNCDRLRFDVSGGQSAPALRFRVAARCLNTDAPITIHAELGTRRRPQVFNRTTTIILTPRGDDGFAYGVAIFPLTGSGFDLEDAEANFRIRLTDADQATTNAALRVRLTSGLLNDLPDIDDTQPTPPPVQCSN